MGERIYIIVAGFDGLRYKTCDEDFRNVFYYGASMVPGTGLPGAMISSKLS